ncbi:MAG: YdeI/OmpD-associated family protein [Anaerolineae bacterium]|nr:YdeI/OmpD-associated family protein [Anaerolineae bacterium]
MRGEPVFFETAADFRMWLEKNHQSETELWVGMYKKSTGRPSITWPEVVDQCLCFGWIDGLRKTIDEYRFMNRITPRKPTSNWSAVNIAKVETLTAQGLMYPAGLEAFSKRKDEKSRVYSFEQAKEAALNEEEIAQFQRHPEAWAWFESRPPGYRRKAIHWVISAKRAETRQKRLAALIEESANTRPNTPLASSPLKRE